MFQFRILILFILFVSAGAHAMEPTSKIIPPPVDGVLKPDLGKCLIANIQNGHEDAVARQIAQGVDVNATDKDGMTALMYAVSYRREGICTMLIDAKVDVNKIDLDGETALHMATRRSLEMCKRLISAGACVNCISRIRLCSSLIGAPEDGYESTPLACAIVAATSNREPICELLVEKMLSPDRAQQQSMFAFMISLRCKNATIPGVYIRDVRRLLCASLCEVIKEYNTAKVLADIKKLPACRAYQRERIIHLLIKYFPNEALVE